MRKDESMLLLAAVAVCGFVCGCVEPRARYVDPGEIVSGVPESPTMYDLETSIQTLMQKMLSSPQFSKNYSAAKTAKGGQPPIVVIGNIANKTTERIQGRLDAVGETLRSALFESSLFEVKDDEASSAISSRILRGADGGLEDGVLVQSMGTQESPDFIVLGDLRHFADVGGYHTYRLRIAFHNLRTGKVVWEGIQTNVKIGDWSSKVDNGTNESTRLALEAFDAGNWSLGFSLAQNAEKGNPEIQQWLGKCYDPFVMTPGLRMSKNYARSREHYKCAEELLKRQKGR